MNMEGIDRKTLRKLSTKSGRAEFKNEVSVDVFDKLAKKRFADPEATKNYQFMSIYKNTRAALINAGVMTTREVIDIERRYRDSDIATDEQDYEWINEVPEEVLSIITLALECYVENTVLIENKERAKEILKAIEG
jgi:hypothetical protein